MVLLRKIQGSLLVFGELYRGCLGAGGEQRECGPAVKAGFLGAPVQPWLKAIERLLRGFTMLI